MKNLPSLACKFDLDQSERKLSQVNASARKPWPNEWQVDPSFQLASTCDSVWPKLNVFICDLRVLARKLASLFGHPTQVSTQIQLASTCDYLPVRLTRANVNSLLKFRKKQAKCYLG